jgi:hypothetical protein
MSSMSPSGTALMISIRGRSSYLPGSWTCRAACIDVVRTIPFSAGWIVRSSEARRSSAARLEMRRAKMAVTHVSPHLASPRCQAHSGTIARRRGGEVIGSSLTIQSTSHSGRNRCVARSASSTATKTGLGAEMNVAARCWIVVKGRGVVRVAHGACNCGRCWPRLDHTHSGQHTYVLATLIR